MVAFGPSRPSQDRHKIFLSISRCKATTLFQTMTSGNHGIYVGSRRTLFHLKPGSFLGCIARQDARMTFKMKDVDFDNLHAICTSWAPVCYFYQFLLWDSFCALHLSNLKLMNLQSRSQIHCKFEVEIEHLRLKQWSPPSHGA